MLVKCCKVSCFTKCVILQKRLNRGTASFFKGKSTNKYRDLLIKMRAALEPGYSILIKWLLRLSAGS